MARLTRIVILFVLLVSAAGLANGQTTSPLEKINNLVKQRDQGKKLFVPVGFGLVHYIPPVFVPTQSFPGNIQVSGVINFGGLAALPRTNYFSFTGTPTAVRAITFPDASITVARTDAAQTITGVQTFVNNIVPSVAGVPSVGTSSLPWQFIYLSGASGTPASNYFRLGGTSTGGQRNIFFQDGTYTVAGIDFANTFSSLQTFNAGVTLGTASTLTLANGVVAFEGKLSTTAAVDMNTATATTLFTCPTGKSCVITKIVVRNASTSLTTASYSFGWTSAAFNDVVATATHTELTGATLYTVLSAKVGSTLGTSTGTFKVLNNVLQGGAATTTMDVFGYVF